MLIYGMLSIITRCYRTRLTIERFEAAEVVQFPGIGPDVDRA